MKTRSMRFNIYLPLVAALAVLCGCHSADSKNKKVLSTLRLHAESNVDSSKRSGPVEIHGFTLNIESAPFLTEAEVKEAKLLDVVGGFEISIQFNRQGSWLL